MQIQWALLAVQLHLEVSLLLEVVGALEQATLALLVLVAAAAKAAAAAVWAELQLEQAKEMAVVVLLVLLAGIKLAPQTHIIKE
jgi:hypothetical protein